MARLTPTKHDGDPLIHDWNQHDGRSALTECSFELHDETLRDGIQNAGVVDPAIDDKLAIVHLLDEVGIDSCDLGLPCASQRAFDDVLRLVREVADQRLTIRPACAGRTLVGDIAPMVEISQKAGIAVEVMTFIGSSPIRQLAENWSAATIIQRSVEAIRFGVSHGLPVTFVTEDTTRSRPELLRPLFLAAIEHGASRLCLCDTVGHVTPDGVNNLLRFTRDLIDETGADVKIDWHGHNDRGLALVNSIFALEHGADRIHGCVLGIGERVGNAPLELILTNLKLLGALPDRDLGRIATLARLVSKATGYPIHPSYPVVGEGAFRTATGVHAAAILKAKSKGDTYLADRIYSSVPASLFGRRQEVGIGPMSGLSNVLYWLAENGVPSEGELVDAILRAAKASDRNLADEDVHLIVDRFLRDVESA